MGAEAVFVVLVEVVGRGAPEEAVRAARVGAAGVLLAVEHEGELTVLPVGGAVLHSDHWGATQGGVNLSRHLLQRPESCGAPLPLPSE